MVQESERQGSFGELISEMIFRQSTSENRRSRDSQNDTSLTSLPNFEDDAQGDYDPRFEKGLKHLRYQPKDITRLVGDDAEFRKMKRMLRGRGCVTNGTAFLRETFQRPPTEYEKENMYKEPELKQKAQEDLLKQPPWGALE